MVLNNEQSTDFYKELETVPIEDYKEVAKGKTSHPFSHNLGPQGTVAPINESAQPVKKFHYIEHKVHGRSIDETATSGKVLWGGEIPFGARDIKGSRHESLEIAVKIKADGYKLIRVQGLYDETELEYLIKASEHLQELGIPTENITAIYKPNEVIYKGDPIPLDEWKKLAKNKYANQVSVIDATGKLREEVNEFLDTTEFYQVERELQVSERIRDLAVCKNKEEFTRVLTGPLNWINVATKVRKQGIIPGTEQPEPFDINNEEDIERFLETWLPSQMGVYLGKLKKAGIKNDFGHAQQWSLAATMYDTQSFVGKALDGETVTVKANLETLEEALGVLEELFNPSIPNYVSQKYGHLLAYAKENLLSRYFSEIELTKSPERNNYVYENLLNNTFYDGSDIYFRTLDPEIYMKAMKKFGVTFSEERIKQMYAYKAGFEEEYRKNFLQQNLSV